MHDNDKRVTFRIDEVTFEDLKEIARKQYLTVSAYIRKQLEESLYKDGIGNELQK